MDPNAQHDAYHWLEIGLDRKRMLAGMLGVVAGGSLLAAESASAAPLGMTARRAAPTTMRIAEADAVTDLDLDGANAATSYTAWETWGSVYDALTDFVLPVEPGKGLTARGLPASPRLARSWDVSKNGRTVRLNLRTGVKSSFGNEFTSQDVVWRLQRALALKSIAAFLLGSIGNLTNPAKIKAIDSHTVQLGLEAPAPDLFRALSLYWLGIVDSTEAKKHATAKDKWAKAWLSKNTAGFGAYTVKSASTQALTMVTTKGYWGAAPPVKQIVIQNVPDPNTRLQLLLSKNVDIATALTPTQLEQAKGTSGFRVNQATSTLGSYLVMNTKQAPFDNPAIRRGIARAIPYDDIVKVAYRGIASRWKTLAPGFFLGATTRYWQYDTDLDAAKAALAPLAGQTLKLSYQAGRGASEQAAILIQTNMKKIGVDVAPDALDPTQFFQREIGGLAFYLVEDGPAIASPLYYYSTFFTKAGIRNLASYTSPEVEALVVQLRTAMVSQNLAAQKTVTEKIQQALANDIPVIPLATKVGALAMTDEFALQRLHNGGGIYCFSRDVGVA